MTPGQQLERRAGAMTPGARRLCRDGGSGSHHGSVEGDGLIESQGPLLDVLASRIAFLPPIA